MKIATQAEIDQFIADAIFDENIYPYLSVSKFISKWTVYETDWEGIILTDERVSFLAHIKFTRSADLEATVSLYAKSNVGAGRGAIAIKQIINRYKPRAVNSMVHASNSKSLILHDKVFGEPWGVENLSAWNSLKGEYEDLFYFRMLL